MIIQEYIDEGHEEREEAKKEILSLIKKHRLYPPDFVENKELYDVIFEGFTIGRFAPWKEDGSFPKYRTALSADRLYIIRQIASVVPDGAFWECGVYTGGVTRMLLDMGKQVVAFDTFEGIKGAGEFDLHKEGEYDGGDVSAYICGAEIVKGEVPKSFEGRNDEIAFCHLDMDIYFPTKAALEYVFPRLIQGGAIILDDYGFWTTPGIKKAVDEFEFGKKIYIPTGQLVIFK